MNPSRQVTEGVVPFRGYRTWYRVVGQGEDPGRYPLLVLHGGPGASHDYLEPVAELADQGRRVIFYDQLGGGKSDHPHDPGMWTIDLFLAELNALRRVLRLQDVHLLGHSWGGMLALEHALAGAPGIVSLVVANVAADMPAWQAEVQRLRRALPPRTYAALLKHEAAGSTTDLEYLAATLAFYRRHVCRCDPWPRSLNQTFAYVARYPAVYQTLYGINDLHVTGRLRDWSVLGRLQRLRLRSLVLSGRHDEATPAVVEQLHRELVGSQWVIFEDSSHTPHLEETAAFLQVVGDFLLAGEAPAQAGALHSPT